MKATEKEANVIRAIASTDGPVMTLNASVNGPVLYLDNWAIGDLAEGNSRRRARFIELMHLGGVELLFSVTNAAELSGPDGRSAEAVRTFLDAIGPRWFPVELSPIDVVKRELSGVAPGAVCICERFLKSYVAELIRTYKPGSGRVISLSEDFFLLGAILDYVGPQRESIRKSSLEFDEILREKLGAAFEKRRRDRAWLDRRFPVLEFNPSRRATFVFNNLLRIMVLEANQVVKGDGMDFCHTLMASAFSSFATLDKRWKRRVENLPKPNQLARIYCGPELDQMVSDMETWLAQQAAS